MEIEKSKTIEIAILDNGYIVKASILEDIDENQNRRYSENEEIIEEEDKNKALVRLLYLIAEKTGYMYDKYGKENLNINFDKKGHKLE